MLGSGLFIVSIAHQPRFVIQHPWIDSLGKISYGIYLYHMVVITGVLFLLQKWVDHGLVLNSLSQILLINAATISITFSVAWLSHKYFESLFYRKP
jgi:peptidoglycan/LPS O-acetylase OafA/YrhL